MKKKLLTLTLVASAVACFVFANRTNVTDVISDNVEALVEATGKEVYSYNCGHWLFEEWIEKQYKGSNNIGYFSAGDSMACHKGYVPCYGKGGVVTGNRTETCWRLDSPFY